MPMIFDFTMQENELRKFKAWIEKKVTKKPNFTEHFQQNSLQNGQTLQVGIRSYQIFIETEKRLSSSGRLKNNIIHLTLSENLDAQERALIQKKLLSKLVGKDQQLFIEQRVRALNDQHFKKKVNKVTMKYNLSNWGSCSDKGNINLSTCLLFADVEVIDYVIIHELAHLIEMNHSPRFWKLVEKAMPDYKEKIKWLQQNWAKCDFTAQ
jgi:predicted metal-dependent hydrolase